MLRGLLLTYLYYRALAISITGGVVHGDELMYGTKPPRRYSVTSSAKGRQVLHDKPSRPPRLAVTSSANGRVRLYIYMSHRVSLVRHGYLTNETKQSHQ